MRRSGLPLTALRTQSPSLHAARWMLLVTEPALGF